MINCPEIEEPEENFDISRFSSERTVNMTLHSFLWKCCVGVYAVELGLFLNGTREKGRDIEKIKKTHFRLNKKAIQVKKIYTLCQSYIQIHLLSNFNRIEPFGKEKKQIFSDAIK